MLVLVIILDEIPKAQGNFGSTVKLGRDSYNNCEDTKMQLNSISNYDAGERKRAGELCYVSGASL
jgi:hypothetical protein